MAARGVLYTAVASVLASAAVLEGIQKLPDNTETPINETSAETSEVIQSFIEEDLWLILVLLALTLIATVSWVLCPLRTLHKRKPEKADLGDPLMHETMETTEQAIRRGAVISSLGVIY